MISLHSLRAFDAVARHLSFSLAADELCVTQGAVSHQVTSLERCLGTILFERVKSKVHLTSKGVKLHAIVNDPLRRIRTGLRTFGPDGNDRTLKIKVPPTLGIRWFVPQLVKFHGTHPEIDVQITTSHQAVDFEHEDVDIAIHWGGGEWPGLSADFLIGEELIPVCSPELLKRTPINSLDDLNDHVLLQSMHRTNDWRIWKETIGGPDVTRRPSSSLASSSRSACSSTKTWRRNVLSHRSPTRRRANVPIISSTRRNVRTNERWRFFVPGC